MVIDSPIILGSISNLNHCIPNNIFATYYS